MHGILTPSGGVADDLVQCFGVARDRVRVIHNGLPLADLRARAAIVPPTYPKTHPWIVTACRLRRGAKDFETLFSGFKRVRARADAELVILGEGPDRAGLEADCSALGIGDQVRFLGYHANPMPYLAAADVFVLSSLAEGFGNVLVEAMAVGTPVVATDCPSGPREILRGGEDGLLVPIRDPEGLANACLSLLLDPGLRQRFAERGRARSEAFDAPAKAAELQDYLSRLGWG
jgi:glycosyltransferase involved in cell wall biosynthesis